MNDGLFSLQFQGPGIVPAGSCRMDEATVDIISTTRVFSNMTSQNVCCERGLWVKLAACPTNNNPARAPRRTLPLMSEYVLIFKKSKPWSLIIHHI